MHQMEGYCVRSITMAALMFLTMSASAYAGDTSPTLAANQSWLASQLPDSIDACDRLTCEEVSRTYRVRNCRVEFDFIDTGTPSVGVTSDEPYYVVKLFPRAGLKIMEGPIHEKVNDSSIAIITASGSASVPLANVDVSRVKLESWQITGEPLEHSAVWLEHFDSNIVTFVTLDGDLARRIQEALLHAAKLCGATKDVF